MFVCVTKGIGIFLAYGYRLAISFGINARVEPEADVHDDVLISNGNDYS